MNFLPGIYYIIPDDELMIVRPDGSHEFSMTDNYYRAHGDAHLFCHCMGKTRECYKTYFVSDFIFIGGYYRWDEE